MTYPVLKVPLNPNQPTYCHCDVIFTALAAPVPIMTFSLWRLAPTALAAPVLIMTSFPLWRHLLLSLPRPPLRTYVTDTFPRLI